MINVHYHQAMNALTTLPDLLVCGGVTELNFEHRIPYLLMLAAAIVNELPDGGAFVGGPDTNPVAMVI